MAFNLPNFTEILKNINAQVPYLWKFMTALTFFIGTCYGIFAMHLFKKYGDARAGSSGQADLRKPAMHMLVAAALLYSPTLLQNILITIYATEQITPYNYSGSGDNVGNFLSLTGNIVQFIGYIAFLRGWMLILRIGDQGQSGVLGRALIHIFAGVFAINIFGTWAILKSLFGV